MMFHKRGNLWQNVPYAEEKLALLRRHGNWLADLTRAAREQSLPSDFSNTVEKPSGPL